MNGLLAGLVVCVLTEDPGAAIAGRHLSELGAEVVASERPGADVVLVDPVNGSSAACARDALVCTFEHHRVNGQLIASEASAQAAIGLTSYVGPSAGPPARIGCDVGSVSAGVSAVQAVLACVYCGRRPGARHDVAVSPLRALSTLKTILWAARSRPDQWVGTHVRSRDREVDSGYRTRDGRITLDFPAGAERGWRELAEELGLDSATVATLQPRWHESVGWGDDVDLARPRYEEQLGALLTDEAVGLIRRNGGSSVPFQTLEECLEHPQSRALGLGTSGAGPMPWRIEPRGGHRVPAVPGDPTRPLAGVRVVDFGVGGVGPFAATLLAWLGADVVKVEAPNEFILAARPTAGGLSTTYLAINQGKRSVSLDLKSEADAEVARLLVADADVVVENFRPGALSRIGFGFDEVRALNPRIVYCSVTGFGSVGPLANEPCTDPHMQAFSGFALENADEEGVPRRVRYYGFVDLVTSMVAAEAICAALLVRATTGGPVRIETSMLEAITHVLRTSREAFVDRELVSAPILRDEDVLARREYWEAGLLRDLPLPHAEPLVAGGPPWRLGSRDEAPPAPAPGQDTDALRADGASFWRPRPGRG